MSSERVRTLGEPLPAHTYIVMLELYSCVRHQHCLSRGTWAFERQSAGTWTSVVCCCNCVLHLPVVHNMTPLAEALQNGNLTGEVRSGGSFAGAMHDTLQ